MDSLALVRQIADGDRFQDLTRPTKALAQDQLFRILRKPDPVVLKVYGTPARARRETHALDALAGIEGVVVRLGGDVNAEVAWSLFADPGEWSLAQLPENSRLGLSAGRILRAVHDSDPGALSNLSRGIDGEAPSIEIGWPASSSSPSMVMATAARARPGPMAAATSSPVVPSGYSRTEPSGRVRWIAM